MPGSQAVSRHRPRGGIIVSENVMQRFSLTNKVIVITGGSGLLGSKHAEAVAEAGGIPVLLDINQKSLIRVARAIRNIGADALCFRCDITNKTELNKYLKKIIKKFGHVDGLVNNAANDPKVGPGSDSKRLTRFEHLSEDYWNTDIAVGLTGAFFCSQVFGHHMATHGGGVIVNIASDLAVISPDQRLYEMPGLAPEDQPVKPVTYSVVKAGLIGLTKYLATYWAAAGVRVNAISPGGVYNNQADEFVQRLSSRIPMGRMAAADEYKASLVYLLSDASSYVTGINLITDGGRTCW
jgi:NAD(P)-dependent dehydrogenase (short-subunit alcohol dehydrogenase family)